PVAGRPDSRRRGDRRTADRGGRAQAYRRSRRRRDPVRRRCLRPAYLRFRERPRDRPRRQSDMTRDIIIGVDSGTSLIKSVAFTTTGEQIAVVALPNDYATLADGGVEQDLRKTWADCAATLRQLAEKVPNLAARVAAIGVTAQGDGTWLIDRDGEPVAPGWLWLDSRAAAIAEAVIEHPDYPTHYETTG